MCFWGFSDLWRYAGEDCMTLQVNVGSVARESGVENVTWSFGLCDYRSTLCVWTSDWNRSFQYDVGRVEFSDYSFSGIRSSDTNHTDGVGLMAFYHPS